MDKGMWASGLLTDWKRDPPPPLSQHSHPADHHKTSDMREESKLIKLVN